MRDPISELIARIGSTKESIAETVSAAHGVDSFEKYQRLVGRNEGLQIALDLLNDILTESEEQDAE
jgi:hypothetical protein